MNTLFHQVVVAIGPLADNLLAPSPDVPVTVVAWFGNVGKIFLLIGIVGAIIGYVIGPAGLIRGAFSGKNEAFGNVLMGFGVLVILAVILFDATINDFALIKSFGNIFMWMAPPEAFSSPTKLSVAMYAFLHQIPTSMG